MKKISIIFRMLLSGIVVPLLLASCSEDKEFDFSTSDLNLEVGSNVSTAYFGDSLTFVVNASDNMRKLALLTTQLYFNETTVSETNISITENGEYTGKIYIPFFKNVSAGSAQLKFILENERGKKATQTVDITLSRPDYPYLTLVTESGEYMMTKVGDNQYETEEEIFPNSIDAYIRAPKFGVNGNEIDFGWINGVIAEGNRNLIRFTNIVPSYRISFNTLTYEAAPFIVLVGEYINGVPFEGGTVAELELTQGEAVVFSGFDDLVNWWIDVDFFNKDVSGNLTFNAITGKYRVTANRTHKTFMVEVMNGDNLASLQSDGTGTVYLWGEGIRKPFYGPDTWSSYSQDGRNKSLCMAPIAERKYQITFIGKQTIATWDGWRASIIFAQQRGGSEWARLYTDQFHDYQNIVGASGLFTFGPSNGDFKYVGTGSDLDGKKIVLTLEIFMTTPIQRVLSMEVID